MHTAITVIKKLDGTFDIFNCNSLITASVAEVSLPAYLNRYMSEERTADVVLRLGTEDKVTEEVLSFGKFEQA